MRVISAACVAIAFGLSGCGGGGSDSPPPPPTVPAPSGLYDGTSSNSTFPEIQLLALENGAVWGIYGRTVNGTFLVAGLLNANGAANNGSYAATDLRDYYFDGRTFAGTVTASYTSAGSWSGSATTTAGVVSFTTQKVAASSYNYDTPAQTSAIAGSWSGTDLGGVPTIVTISSSGAVSGNSNGCLFTGSVSPRASGKNVFDVSVTFANGQLCAVPGTTATGMGLTYPILGTTRSQILVGLQNPARTLGDAFLAIR